MLMEETFDDPGVKRAIQALLSPGRPHLKTKDGFEEFVSLLATWSIAPSTTTLGKLYPPINYHKVLPESDLGKAALTRLKTRVPAREVQPQTPPQPMLNKNSVKIKKAQTAKKTSNKPKSAGIARAAKKSTTKKLTRK